VAPFAGVTDDTVGVAAKAGIPSPPATTTPVVADTSSLVMVRTLASSLSGIHVMDFG
jgi:hypothetical protein